MDTLTGLIDSQTVLVVAAIAISLILVTLLYRILKASLGLILVLLAIVLILQYGFGISPAQVWSEMNSLPRQAVQLVQNFNVNSWLD
ncbi:MAG TPA: hypothetical protein V6C78_29600 [Crinalium sp.]